MGLYHEHLRRLGHERNFVSVGTKTRVQTNVAIGSIGFGRVAIWNGVGWSWAVGGIVAPVRVTATDDAVRAFIKSAGNSLFEQDTDMSRLRLGTAQDR